VSSVKRWGLKETETGKQKRYKKGQTEGGGGKGVAQWTARRKMIEERADPKSHTEEEKTRRASEEKGQNRLGASGGKPGTVRSGPYTSVTKCGRKKKRTKVKGKKMWDANR